MARSEQIRGEIARLEATVAGYEKDLVRHQKSADDARAKAHTEDAKADKAKTDSTRRSARSAAERRQNEATRALKKVAELRGKIAATNKNIASKRVSLKSAEQTEQRSQDRDEDRRRQKEKAHARDLARISTPSHQIRYVQVQPAKPEPLRVLYLTANPHATESKLVLPDGSVETTGVWLRVDQEVRQVKQSLRASKFRDLVEIEHLPAATGLDIIDGLNDHRPHVVHFSGHANSWGVLLENGDGSIDGAELEFSLFARALGATDEPPRLVVLNACESLYGADDLLQTVPTVIGMSESITDIAAVTFAAKFYAGIASAQSVATAVEQAKVAMQMSALDDSHLPEIRTRDGLDPLDLVLVKPPV